MDSAATAVGSARQVSLEEAYSRLLMSLPSQSPGTRDTPARAAKAWDELTSGYYTDPYDLVTSFDAEGHDELVCVSGIPFYSLCEHHLLPFHGTADVGYIPDGRIIGLSKISRIVDAYARRLQVQERLTDQIADVLVDGLQARGVIVIMRAEHLCMTMRGVNKPAMTTTSVVRGLLKENTAARQEALALFAAQP